MIRCMQATIEISGCSEKIFRAIKPEEDKALSKAKVYQSGDKLVVEIEADDVSDLRAAVNSWLRLIKMCIELEEVLKHE